MIIRMDQKETEKIQIDNGKIQRFHVDDAGGLFWGLIGFSRLVRGRGVVCGFQEL